MKRLTQAPLAALLSALLLAATAAQAQGAKGQSMEERLRAELRNVTAQLQQARAELDQRKEAPVAKPAPVVAAAPANDKLKQELAHSQAQLATARAERSALAAEQARSQVAAQEAAASLKQYRQANDSLAGAGKSVAAERQRLDAELAAQRVTVARCESQNARLYAAGKEILDAYTALSVVDVMRARQPFAAQSRVKLDDIAQQYGDKLYEGRFDARTPAAPAPAAN